MLLFIRKEKFFMFTINYTNSITTEQLQQIAEWLELHCIDFVVKSEAKPTNDITAEIKDIKAILNAVTYDIDTVAYYCIISNYYIFDEIDKTTDLTKLIHILQDESWFSDKVNDYYQIHRVIKEALVETTQNAIWEIFGDKYANLLDYNTPEIDEILKRLDRQLFNPIISRINELVKPYIHVFCRDQFQRLKK